MPNFYTKEWGSLLEAKALLNRLVNWVSRPPIPKAYKEKFLENTFFWTSLEDFNLIFWSDEAEQINLVFFDMNENPSSVPKTL